MSLPSQSTRASRSAGVSYRQSRTNPVRRYLTPAIIVAVLALIVWFATRPGPNAPQDPDAPIAQAGTERDSTDDDANPDPDADDAPDTVAARTDATPSTPVIIDQTAPPRPLPGAPRREPTPVEDIETDNAEPPADDAPPTSANQSDSGSLLTNTLRRAEGRDTRTSTDASTPSTPTGTIAPIQRARELIRSGRRVEARQRLSDALREGGLSESERAAVRGMLADINSVLVFGPVAADNDPITEEYTVRPGDSLSRIAARRELATHWKLIQRVNNIANSSRIRLGQTLKLVRGPFHAVVHKSKYRMDIYHGPPADPDEWLFIRSVRVGLGLDDGTPAGRFRVSNKLENPGWVNPRDGSERYTPDDPDNPIGEHWIGLDGIGDARSLTGYGIHGTIEPDSIGREESMGCIRCAQGDIDLVYELLAPGVSIVEIRP